VCAERAEASFMYNASGVETMSTRERSPCITVVNYRVFTFVNSSAERAEPALMAWTYAQRIRNEQAGLTRVLTINHQFFIDVRRCRERRLIGLDKT